MYYDNYAENEDTEFIENEYLTPKEVMSLLYIGKNSFYKLVGTGQLPAFRLGKLWRVKKSDMEMYFSKA